MRIERLRQPVFGPHGRKVVAGLCAWELLALPPGSPLPTLSEVVGRHPIFGVALLLLLGHHWYLEDALQAVADVIDAITPDDYVIYGPVGAVA